MNDEKINDDKEKIARLYKDMSEKRKKIKRSKEMFIKLQIITIVISIVDLLVSFTLYKPMLLYIEKLFNNQYLDIGRLITSISLASFVAIPFGVFTSKKIIINQENDEVESVTDIIAS